MPEVLTTEEPAVAIGHADVEGTVTDDGLAFLLQPVGVEKAPLAW